MPASLETARDEIFAAFAAVWPAGTRVDWDGVPANTRPSPTESWAQAVVRHVAGKQISFAPAKFEHVGVAIFAIYGTTRAAGEALASTVRAAFECKGTASGVWFPRVRVVEVGADDAWYHWNVEVDFRWEER